MLIIADSGATKTDWCLVNNNKSYFFSTIGFSPYFQTTASIAKEIKTSLMPQLDAVMEKKNKEKNIKLYFYGSGCSSVERCEVIHGALRLHFPNASIEINHDLLGAARALCGHQKGIAAILGTGSNSCYYDGKKIIENVPSLGYVLGDEGSGAYLGKTFLQSYFHQEVPAELSKLFITQYSLTRDDILNHLYRKPLPSKYLSSFVPFFVKHKKDAFIQGLIIKAFSAFFDKYICKYAQWEKTTFHCVGSVGFLFKPILSDVATDRGIKIGNIIKEPMSFLIKYHSNY